MSALPEQSDANLFRYRECLIDLNAEIAHGALYSRVPEQQLHRSQIASSAIDQRGLSSSQRMGAEQPRVEANATDPTRDKAGVLPRCHALPWTTPAGEQELAWPLASSSNVVINRMPGLLGHLEPNWPTGFSLPDSRAIDGVPIWRNILNLEGDNITTAQFAVYREIEHGQVSRLPLDLEPCPD